MKPHLVPLTLALGLAGAAPTHAAILHVNASNTSPAAPFHSWTDAATNIQDAIDAASPGDLLLVTNGVYQFGGKAIVSTMTNRVAINKAVTVQSVNGPTVTIIQGHQLAGTTNGDGAIRCVYVGSGATLSGFTLTGGGTRASGLSFDEQSGGGAWCESATSIVTNCVFTGNAARFAGAAVFGGTLRQSRLSGNTSHNHGGGAYRSMIDGCIITENRARFLGGGSASSALTNSLVIGNTANSGGGIYFSDAVNCTIVSNTAALSAGGAYSGSLQNCIVYFNSAPDGNFAGVAVEFDHCCTFPLPAGAGNITNQPSFLDSAAGNFQLHPQSPCINAGKNAPNSSSTDLAGLPRVRGETIDIGAYEFQDPLSRISYAWLLRHGLPYDGSADDEDTDGDGLTCWQEWKTRTDPNNAMSVLCVRSPELTDSGLLISWESVAGVLYRIERSSQPAGGVWDLIASGFQGQAGVSTFLHQNPLPDDPGFYRVGVE